MNKSDPLTPATTDGSVPAAEKRGAPARDIRTLTRGELEERFRQWGQPAYRLDQVMQWLYARRVESWDQMSNVPRALRERLAEAFSLGGLVLARAQGARDATRKFLWRLEDGAFVESVLIPANPALYGEASDRQTLCVSTQVGCAYGCRFCASGLDGFRRNLSAHEIIGQVLAVERLCEKERQGESLEGARREASGGERAVSNLVIMGMGEPLANYSQLMRALEILNAPWGGGIGARKITVSTSGLAPQIKKLAEEPFQFRLAISLHGATDEVRNRIMPVNQKYPLAELTAACEHYQQRKGKMITLEYILIEDVNVGDDQAPALAALAQRLRAKVNLIPYNRVEGLPWARPSDESCEAFAAQLTEKGVTVTLRREKGHDIDAACGQLRLKTERELAGRGEAAVSV